MSELVDFHPVDKLYRDQENIELVKEGRRAEAVLNMINHAPNDRRNAIDEAKEAFETRINAHETRMEGKEANYGPQDDEDDEDPLRIWVQYVEWLRDHCILGSAFRLEVIPVLENALQKLQDNIRYKNDVRYVKLWLTYAEFSTIPLDVYKYMYAHDIGNLMAAFYEAYALTLEKRGMWNDADLVYSEGFKIKAQPLERLKRHYKEFQQRMAEVIGDFDSENVASKRDRHGERRPLQALGVQVQHQLVGQQNSQRGTTLNDFELKPDSKQPTPIKTGPLVKGAVSWGGFFPLETRKNRENQIIPSRWTELGTLPLKPTEHLSKRRSQEEDVLDVPVIPQNLNLEALRSSKSRLEHVQRVSNELNAQSSASSQVDEEISFEEMRAKVYNIEIIQNTPVEIKLSVQKSHVSMRSPSVKPFNFSNRLHDEEFHVASPTINTKAALRDVMEMFSQPLSKTLTEEDIQTILPNNSGEDTFTLPVWPTHVNTSHPVQFSPKLEKATKFLENDNQENIDPLGLDIKTIPQMTRSKGPALQEIKVSEMPEYKALFEELEIQRENKIRATSDSSNESIENIGDEDVIKEEDPNMEPPTFRAFYKEPDIAAWKFQVYEDSDNDSHKMIPLIQSTPSKNHVSTQLAPRHRRDPLTPILELSTELDRSLVTNNLSGILYRNLSPVKDIENEKSSSNMGTSEENLCQQSQTLIFDEHLGKYSTYRRIATPCPFNFNTDVENMEILVNQQRFVVRDVISRTNESRILLVTVVDDTINQNSMESEDQTAWALKMSSDIKREFYTYQRLGENSKFSDFIRICGMGITYDDSGCLFIEYSDQPTLADVIQMYRGKAMVFPEILILFYVSKLLKFIELLHEMNIVHCNLSPSHLLLKMDEVESDHQWSTSYDPSGGHNWNRKGLNIVGFAHSIHVNLEPHKKDAFLQDYEQICHIAFSLLFPSNDPAQMFDKIKTSSNTGERPQTSSLHLPSLSTSIVPLFWPSFFDRLLRVPNSRPVVDILSSLRQEIDQILVSQASNGRSLKSSLKQLEVFMFEYKSSL